MSRKILILSLLLGTAAALLVWTPVGTVISREVQDVLVVNFPDPQRVEGIVAVDGPIRSASLTALPDIIVSPVEPTDTTRLISGGTLVTDGYPYVVLSLAAQVKGKVGRAGSIGVILLPEEEPILRAFDEDGQLMFPLQLAVAADPGHSSYLASTPSRIPVAFPRYRVFLYNTSDKTMSATLYAYLTSG